MIRPEAVGVGEAAWKPDHLGDPRSSRFASILTQDEDESPIRQKAQEITQIFPTTRLFGNSHQHRRWTTRLPSRFGHRPQG